MSAKIAVSYEHDTELEAVAKALAPLGVKVKPTEKRGRFRRAYITFDGTGTLDKTGRKRYTMGAEMDTGCSIDKLYPIP